MSVSVMSGRANESGENKSRSGAPAFVLGTAQLGLAYGIANRTGMPDAAEACDILRAALAAGVTAFDTARAYGESETRLGAELGARANIRIVTKLSPLEEIAADAGAETAAAAAVDSLARSRRALRRERLDVVLLHRAAHRRAWNGAVWDALRRARDAGGIGALGVSAQTPEEALDALADPEIVHLQIPFNLLDRRWTDAGVDAAARKRAGTATIHARSVLLQGLLADVPGTPWPAIAGVDPEAIRAALRRLAAELGRDGVADLAIGYAKAQGWIDGLVLGAETRAQFEITHASYARAPLADSGVARVRAAIPGQPAALLDPSRWPRN